MLVLDDTIVNVALPSMQRSLHLATSHLNWVISFYARAFGGLLLVGGRAGDLLGRLRVFRVGIIVLTLASLAGGRLWCRRGWCATVTGPARTW